MKKTGATEIAALRSASLSNSEVPQRVLLAPWGTVESTNGSFIVDEEGSALALHEFSEHATDLPIDYEHQTLGGPYASPNGQAPAAGWIKRLLPVPGEGLFAEIEWTEQAVSKLTAKEYRYLSPVAIVRKSDRKLVGIHSAALTNKPAIVGMAPIVNRHPVTADEDDVAPLTLLRRDLGLPEELSAEEVLVAASRRLATLAEIQRRQEVETRVAQAIRSGQLVEAQREWAWELAMRDEALFDEWLRTAPVVISHGRLQSPTNGNSTHRRRVLTARARAEYLTQPLLQQLTSEEAYVEQMLREIAIDAVA